MKKQYMMLAASVVAISMVTSCGLYKKYDIQDEQSDLIKEYTEALKERPDSLAFGNLDYRQVFTEPMLQDLIAQALEHNVDLRNAKLNIDVAQAQLQGSKLAYFPAVALSPNGAGSSFDKSALSWTYQLPLSVSWEVDVFGKLLNAKRSAQASLLQSEAYEQAVRSQIIGAVANTYYTLASLKAHLQLNEATAKLWSENVQTMRDLKAAGRVNESAVVQAQAQYNSILAATYDIKANIVQANNTMSLLQNVMPQEWNIPAEPLLLQASPIVQGVPMSQLAARPDVRAAEQSLAVAYYATNSARAAFYPSLSITAAAGLTNSAGGYVVNPGKFFANLAGQLTAPLFSRGKNIATLKAAKAQQQQTMNKFEYTLMSAAAEVSNAMAAYVNASNKLNYLDQQVTNLQQAVDITEELLQIGGMGTTYLEVLTAQQNLLSAQSARINCYLSATQAQVNLYQSLGGGR